MWNKIKNLKLYKQIKPSNRAISDSEHRDFLNQIATAPNTAMCPDVSFSLDLRYRYTNSNFSARELLDFLNSRNPDSAKGLDNISYRMLLALPLEQIEKLVSLLNITLDNGVISEQWRKIRENTCSQKNLDSSIITNNRPICLLCVTFKCLEGLIKLRMEEHI